MRKVKSSNGTAFFFPSIALYVDTSGIIICPRLKLDHDLSKIFKPFKFIASQLRKLMPYFYYLGLGDCDTGTIHEIIPVFAFNYWHLQKLGKYYDGWGDWNDWHEIKGFRSILHWFKTYRKYNR